MAVRGSRFAAGREPRRDDEGHSLPSDPSMRFVAIELVCRGCQSEGKHVVLGSWAIDTTFEEFRSEEIWERGDNTAVTTQLIPDGSGQRVRYRLVCPRCHRIRPTEGG